MSAALRRVCQCLGLRDLPRQPRRLPRQRPTHRTHRRKPRRSPRLRLLPLPQRPHRLGARTSTEELAGRTTSRDDDTVEEDAAEQVRGAQLGRGPGTQPGRVSGNQEGRESGFPFFGEDSIEAPPAHPARLPS